MLIMSVKNDNFAAFRTARGPKEATGPARTAVGGHTLDTAGTRNL